MTAKRIALISFFVLMSSLLSGCGLIEIIAEGFARVCETDPLLVTKTADTNDSLCTGDDCSLREALVTANNCPGHQTIQVPGGTYILTRAGAEEDAADTGDLDITETVTIEGELGAALVVDADGLDRVFHVLPSAGEVVLSGLTVQGGLVELPTGWARGGGIFNEADLSLRESTLVGNRVVSLPGSTFISSGGGLHNSAVATLVNVELRDNQAEAPTGGQGGGVFNDGNLVMSEVRFEGNQVGNQGGGLKNGELGTAEIGNSSFVGNRADKGGGLTNDGELTLDNVAFTDNTADTIGGGIWNQFGQLDGRMVALSGNHSNSGGGGFYNWEPATATLTHSAFTGNSAGDFAGALYNEGQITLQQTSLTGNSSAGGAGAIYQSNAPTSMELINVTISDNVSAPGNAAVFSGSANLNIFSSTIANNPGFGISAGASTTVKNTIVSGNGDGDCNPSASLTSGGHNLIGDGSCGLAAAGDISGDPLLQPLIPDGWVGQVHPLDAGSPAIDVGIGGAGCPAQDQRAVARPQGSACDIGAYEFEAGASDSGAAGATATPGSTPTVTAEPLGPIAINFNADSYSIFVGQCTTLRWAVENAQQVFFQGQAMPATEAEQVCPIQTTQYTLQAQNEQEQTEASLTIEVSEPPPNDPGSLQVSNYQCTANGVQVALSWDDRADNEDGYRVYRNGSLLATLGANATSYQDTPPFGGPYSYGVEAYNASGASSRPTIEAKACQSP